jgi:tyrosyl-tRNA synthetase
VSILEELKWRGLIADCTDAAELEKKISAPITLYCGFDPTADSLHVGNLVPLLALRRFQLLGHFAIAVAGGATGSIGDPSGKTQERQLLTKEILESNIASIKMQLAKLLDFDTKTNPARLVDNASWTVGISFLDFLRDIGKHFSVNQMVAKESVRARMEDRETGISYTEFSYMLLQAFDFMVLSRDHNCELQIGGSDQWGNITAGIDLCRKKLGETVFGLTLPLITNADGTKFGKTEAGTVWLDANRTSVEDFYQFWIRTDDRDVIRYLKFFTFLSREEIEGLEDQHKAKPESRAAHQALAKELRNLIHPSATGVAERASKILFGTLFENYTSDDWEFLAKHSHSIEVEKTKLVGMPLVELLVLADLSSSKGQARKDIEGRGISINNSPPLPNFGYNIQASDMQLGRYLRLRKGKKNHVVVTAK